MGSLLSMLMMSRTIQFVGLAALAYGYIVFTPFTKVEESFSLQAIHDFIYLGIPRALDITNKLVNGSTDWYLGNDFLLDFSFSSKPINIVHTYNHSDWRWDHEDFPGPVPRTFIGSFIVSLFAFPWSLYQRTSDKIFVQLAVRTVLATSVLIGFYTYACAVTRKFGHHTTSALAIVTLSQFHFLFYSSRPLPNTFALVLVLFASAKWLSRRYTSFIVLVAITVIIFRSETALFFFPMLVHSWLYQRNLSLKKLFRIGIPAGLISLTFTVLFDSFMWKKWVWPEGYGIFFNVYLNKSSDWGVQPFLWYFYSALPRSLLFTVFFVPFASRRCIKTCLTVSVAFITLYSFLGHKELRFIIYCLPMLNTCAANAMAITAYRFFTLKPHPESWLVHRVCCFLGMQATPECEFEDQEKKMDDREDALDAREAKKMRRFGKSYKPPKSKLPDKYDAIPSVSHSSASNPFSVPSVTPTAPSASANLKKRSVGSKVYDGTECEGALDQQYSKITAVNLDKAKGPKKDEPIFTGPSPSRRIILEEPPTLDTAYLPTVILVLMALHIWINIGFLVYASVASWHNYPGGDAVYWTNEQIKSVEMKTFKPEEIAVYVCNLAAQTGFTRFLQINGVTYDKSSDYQTLANKSSRVSKYRQFGHSNPSINRDFKLIYFILEGLDVNFLSTLCSSTARSPEKSSAKRESAPPIRLTSTIDSVVCKLSPELQDCSLVKAINGFDGIDLSRAPYSIFILTVPKLWIFRCEIH